MNTLYSNQKQVTVKKDTTSNVNCSVPFVKHFDSREQELNIDPGELYYNPSTSTLHCDNFSGGIPSLLEGEAIELTTANNSTTIDVNFDKNTEVTTSVATTDKILVSNAANEIKTITGENLRASLKPSAGDNLEFGTGADLNKISLKSVLTNISLGSSTTWNGSLIAANKLSNGSVSDTDFQRLSGLSSAIL